VFVGAFSGNFTILTYTADIVKSSGSSFKANEAAMIIAGVQFIGIYIASQYVDKFGRKVSFIDELRFKSDYSCN